METEMRFQDGTLMMRICINNTYLRSVLSIEMYIKTYFRCQIFFFPFSHESHAHMKHSLHKVDPLFRR
jgi:hypothetical protein